MEEAQSAGDMAEVIEGESELKESELFRLKALGLGGEGAFEMLLIDRTFERGDGFKGHLILYFH